MPHLAPESKNLLVRTTRVSRFAFTEPPAVRLKEGTLCTTRSAFGLYITTSASKPAKPSSRYRPW